MSKLTQIQNELKAPKNQFNAFGKYKYRSQEDILEAVKPLLKKHECTLFISDEIKEVGNVMYVETTCTFSDGEEIKIVKAQAGIDINRKGMDIAQCFGSSSSYSRKYALNGLFLIDDTKDADATNEHDSKPKEATRPSAKQQTALPALPELPKSGDIFDKAKAYILGGGNVQAIRKNYVVTKEVENLLNAK